MRAPTGCRFGSRFATVGWGLAVVALVLPSTPALSDDQPPAFFDPLATVAPGITREVGLLFDHVRASDGRLTQTSLRLQYPVLSWLQFSLEMPVVVEDPDSNVFHKALPWAGGVLTIGGTQALLRTWRMVTGQWVADTHWNPKFGGKFDRLSFSPTGRRIPLGA